MSVAEAARAVLIERTGSGGNVAWLTLNRPAAMNALSKDLVRGLRAGLGRLRHEPGVCAVVLTGAGEKAFCAGADLKERVAMTLDDTRAFLVELNATIGELAAFPRPVIAALNGVAFGGGLELALACDIRIAAAGVTMGLLEVKLGIIPGAGGTQRLSRLCGVALAKELILTGRRIDAARAREVGLCSTVVPPAGLRAEAQRWADEIAAAGPLALEQAKRAIDQGWGKSLPEALAIESACYEVVLKSQDRNEGLQAFAEKRKPVFTGK